jgi:uncharacterized protein YndB with AHSA1/START domain
MAAVVNAAGTREIRIVRVYDAPRELVWRAWTQAEDIAAWWGPEDFQATAVESDPRPGGALRIVMCGPDGVEHPSLGVYQIVVEKERLVVLSTVAGADGTPVMESTHTVELADAGAGTKVTLTARAVALVPEAAPMLGGMQAGWNQSLQCLDDEFTGAVNRQIVLSRLLRAGLRALDAAGAPFELVGTRGILADHPRHGRASGWSVAVHDARPGRHGVRQRDRLRRDPLP